MGEAGQAVGVSGPFLPAPLSLPPTHREYPDGGCRGHTEKGEGKKGLLFLTTPPARSGHVMPPIPISCSHNSELGGGSRRENPGRELGPLVVLDNNYSLKS